MSKLHILSNNNCVSCVDAKRIGRFITDNRPYAGNFNRIPDSIDNNAERLNAKNFFAFSINNQGYFIYKKDGRRVELQPINFRDAEATYLNKRGNQPTIGVG